MACEREADAALAGKWQEVDSYNSYHGSPGARDTSIVFYPDGRFQGSIVGGYAYYSIIDRGRLSLEDENRNRIHLYTYFIRKHYYRDYL